MFNITLAQEVFEFFLEFRPIIKIKTLRFPVTRDPITYNSSNLSTCFVLEIIKPNYIWEMILDLQGLLSVIITIRFWNKIYKININSIKAIPANNKQDSRFILVALLRLVLSILIENPFDVFLGDTIIKFIVALCYFIDT
jgi:hypothetical protein